MGLGLHRCTKDLNSGGDLEVKNEGSHKSNSIMFEELTCGCKLCPENVGTEGETSNFIVQGTLREGPVKLWISSVYSHTNAPLMGQMAGENSSSSTPRSCFMLFLAASRQPQQFVRRAVSRWAAVGRARPAGVLQLHLTHILSFPLCSLSSITRLLIHPSRTFVSLLPGGYSKQDKVVVYPSRSVCARMCVCVCVFSWFSLVARRIFWEPL